MAQERSGALMYACPTVKGDSVMRTYAKVAIATLCAAAVLAVHAFAGCSSQSYVTSIAKTGTDGSNDI